MFKSIFFRLCIICILLLISFTGEHFAVAAESKLHFGIRPRTIEAPSKFSYRLFPQEKLAFDFVVARPSIKNKRVVLCIPAAFTMQDGTIDGLCIINGVKLNGPVNKELGGAMIIERGNARLLSTNKGAILNKNFLNIVKAKKASMFQQFLIVQNGTPASFRDQSKFQRRAVCQSKHGAFLMVESESPVTFMTFNSDLASIGMVNAIYLDMGSWDEGWYRDATSGTVVTIGLNRSRTESQSNWLLLKK